MGGIYWLDSFQLSIYHLPIISFLDLSWSHISSSVSFISTSFLWHGVYDGTGLKTGIRTSNLVLAWDLSRYLFSGLSPCALFVTRWAKSDFVLWRGLYLARWPPQPMGSSSINCGGMNILIIPDDCWHSHVDAECKKYVLFPFWVMRKYSEH